MTPRILIVDDEKDILKAISRSLRSSGYTIETASSAQDAIRLMEAQAFDLVLTDIRMPGMSGIDLIRHLSRLYPKTLYIVMTGHGDVDIAVEAMKIGAFDFMQKPIDYRSLRIAIESALGHYFHLTPSGSHHETEDKTETFERIGRLKFLIVDDNANNLFLLRALLDAHFDALVVEASTARQALKQVNEETFDLILMDVQMPEMDGFEATSLIKSRPQTAHIPIILLTAYDPDQQFIEHGLEKGAVDYLAKPINDDQLIHRIRVYLRFIERERQINQSLALKVRHRLREVESSNRALKQEAEERIQAEAEARLLKEKLQYILDASGSMIFTAKKDAPMKLHFQSENLYEILGVERSYFEEGLNAWIRRIHHDDRNSLQDIEYNKGKTDFYALDFRFEKSPNEFMWIHAEAGLKKASSGKNREWFGYWMDISKLKKLQKAVKREKELNNLKSAFVSLVSHEFRTPLGIIQGSSQLLERYAEKMTEDARKEKFTTIYNAIHRMTHLMDDVLLHGKIEAGALEFKPVKCDIRNFCNTILDEVKLSHSTSSQNIHIDIAPELQFCEADENLLHHILSNLISNAIKYSPENGNITLSIKETYTNEKSYLEWSVTDAGIGIPAKDLERMGKPFHRSSNVGTIQGTGMGLAIVHRCIEKHGGTLHIKSEEGKGSTFSVIIPQNDSHSNHDEKKSQASG